MFKTYYKKGCVKQYKYLVYTVPKNSQSQYYESNVLAFVYISVIHHSIYSSRDRLSYVEIQVHFGTVCILVCVRPMTDRTQIVENFQQWKPYIIELSMIYDFHFTQSTNITVKNLPEKGLTILVAVKIKYILLSMSNVKILFWNIRFWRKWVFTDLNLCQNQSWAFSVPKMLAIFKIIFDDNL